MICRYFKIQELVPRSIYEVYGESAWRFLRPDLLILLDTLRVHFGPITINDWSWGGSLQNCGLRAPDSPTGAYMSIHKLGGAGDLHFSKYTPQEAFDKILADNAFWYAKGLRRLEDIAKTPTWLHVDCANTEAETIQVFSV